MKWPRREHSEGRATSRADRGLALAAAVLATVAMGMAFPTWSDDDAAPAAPASSPDSGLNCLGELTAGYQALEAGEPARAVEHYRAAVAKADHKGERFQAYVGLGSAETALGRDHEAVAAFEEARTLQPDDGETLLLLGLAYAGDGQVDQAVATLEEAARRQPDLPAVHHNLGLLYARLGWHEQAAAAERRALQLDPSDVQARLGLAVALFHLGSFEDAIVEFRRVVARDASSAGAAYGLGLALLYAGDTEAAMEEQRRLQTLDASLAADLSERIRLRRR